MKQNYFFVLCDVISKRPKNKPRTMQKKVMTLLVGGHSYSAGYNWCVDTIKMSPQHSQLSNDLEINKAVMFLRQKDFTSAVDTLKAFERQEGTKVASTASTNLSFLYFLQGDAETAEKYAGEKL